MSPSSFWEPERLQDVLARTQALGERSIALRTLRRISLEVDPRTGRTVSSEREDAVACVRVGNREQVAEVTSIEDVLALFHQAPPPSSGAHKTSRVPLPSSDSDALEMLAHALRAGLGTLPLVPHVLLVSRESRSSWFATPERMTQDESSTSQWSVRAETAAGALVESAQALELGEVGPVLRRLHEAAEALVDAKGELESQLPWVMRPQVAALYLAGLAPMFDGSVAASTPGLAQSVGKKLFPAVLSLVDDPAHPLGTARRHTDDEGVPCVPLTLVQGGKLQEFLHSKRSAQQLGVVPNGRAFLGSGVAAPSCAPVNLHVVPDAAALPADCIELCARLETFTFAHKGRVTLIAGGYTVRDGKRVERLRPLDLNLSALEVFRKLRGVGQDLAFFPVLGGIGTPSLVFEPLR